MSEYTTQIPMNDVLFHAGLAGLSGFLIGSAPYLISHGNNTEGAIMAAGVGVLGAITSICDVVTYQPQPQDCLKELLKSTKAYEKLVKRN